MRTALLAAFASLVATQTPAQDLGELALARGPRFFYAPSTEATPIRIDVGNTRMLSRRITVDLRDVTLEAALAEITRQAGLKLSYSKAIVPLEKQVRLVAQEITVAGAISAVLFDVDVDVLFTSSGQAVLVRRQDAGTVAMLVGSISGKVTDSSRVDVSGASVTVAGTRLGATTGSDGSYTIAGVSAGSATVVVRRLGFRTQSRDVTVQDNTTTTADFTLLRMPTVLSEIVVTPTGDRQRLEVGNSIGTIKADSVVQTTLVRNVSDLLQARVAGVIVSNTSGLVGAPSRVRIRGINSMTLNNDPIVIVDGMRLVSQTSASNSQTNVGAITTANTIAFSNIGGNFGPKLAPSRLDDIDPTTIESIDVLRGPSASSLYGTEAANGVIVIKTKRGRSGQWRSNIMADEGTSYAPTNLPDFWYGWGVTNAGAMTTQCFLAAAQAVPSVESGTCTQDSVTHFNPQNDPQLRTLGNGNSRNLSLSTSGGSDQLQQFLSFRISDAVGMARMSEMEKRRISRLWTVPAPSWMVRPNTERALSASSQTNLRMGPRLNVGLSVNGAYRNVLNGGVGFPTVTAVGSQGASYGPTDTLRYLSSESQRAKQTTTVKRGFASINGTFDPLKWLQFRGTLGGDYTSRSDQTLMRITDCTPALAFNGGAIRCLSGRTNNMGEILVGSADFNALLTFTPRTWLGLRTALGEQYSKTRFDGLNASNGNGTNLAFGSDLLAPNPVPTAGNPQLFTVAESRDEGVTAGWYVEQTGSFRDRLYLTAGLRQDAASAFGANVNDSPPIYPKYSVSWLASEEEFFPKQRWLTNARLRLAYGHSGNQASQTNVLHGFQNGQFIVEGVTTPIIVLSRVGNRDLRPERTAEWEAGVDLAFLDNERVRLELTRYKKRSRDAAMNLTLSPSYGAGGFTITDGTPFPLPTTQMLNVGSVENKGTEASLSAMVLDMRKVTWDVVVNYSQNANKLLKKDPNVPQGISGTLASVREGYPLFGYWGQRAIAYSDANGDGILGFNEVTWSKRQFVGAPYPKSEITYVNNVGLLDGMLRFNMNLDQINGLSNPTRNNSQQTQERAYYDRTASLDEQLAALSARTTDAYLDPSSSLRLTELSVTFAAPANIVRRYMRAQTAMLTLAGRNLGLWTSYRRGDPNVDTSNRLQDAFLTNDGGVPQPKMLAIRINLGY